MKNRLLFKIGIMALISIFMVSVYGCGLFSPYEGKKKKKGGGGGGKGGGNKKKKGGGGCGQQNTAGGGGGGGCGTWIVKNDSDGDGKVSKSEFMVTFTGRDANGDKSITVDEWNEKNITRNDTDGDGMVSEDEFAATFNTRDANGDGFVDAEEGGGGGGGGR